MINQQENITSSNTFPDVDVYETRMQQEFPEVLDTLLRDHTTGRNIFWATSDYENLGAGYEYHSEILPSLITGEHGMVIRPRTLKAREQQSARSKEMAEVFTPAWVCNAQNNLVDEAWFGRKGVFNTETTLEDGTHTWVPATEPITFPDGKTWKDYVRATRMEITCGEAPYLVSRYDVATGSIIPIEKRIGLLDRKLRVVSENTETSGEWLEWAQEAFKHTLGYEWQGDNLLLARENLLYTFLDYYYAKFGKRPLEKSINYIAYIISWNLWQMDGIRGVVPDSCKNGVIVKELTLFGEEERMEYCPGCQQEDILRHNGIYCLLRDWGNRDARTGENNRKIRYIDLLKK